MEEGGDSSSPGTCQQWNTTCFHWTSSAPKSNSLPATHLRLSMQSQKKISDASPTPTVKSSNWDLSHSGCVIICIKSLEKVAKSKSWSSLLSFPRLGNASFFALFRALKTQSNSCFFPAADFTWSVIDYYRVAYMNLPLDIKYFNCFQHKLAPPKFSFLHVIIFSGTMYLRMCSSSLMYVSLCLPVLIHSRCLNYQILEIVLVECTHVHDPACLTWGKERNVLRLK